MSWWWPFKRRLPERLPERPTCRHGLCNAWAWELCTGGRCKYHCDTYCKCMQEARDVEQAIMRNA